MYIMYHVSRDISVSRDTYSPALPPGIFPGSFLLVSLRVLNSIYFKFYKRTKLQYLWDPSMNAWMNRSETIILVWIEIIGVGDSEIKSHLLNSTASWFQWGLNPRPLSWQVCRPTTRPDKPRFTLLTHVTTYVSQSRYIWSPSMVINIWSLSCVLNIDHSLLSIYYRMWLRNRSHKKFLHSFNNL